MIEAMYYNTSDFKEKMKKWPERSGKKRNQGFLFAFYCNYIKIYSSMEKGACCE
jgi:hypothetical protein